MLALGCRDGGALVFEDVAGVLRDPWQSPSFWELSPFGLGLP